MLLQEIQSAHKESEDFFEQLEIARADSESTRRELAAARGADQAARQELEHRTRDLQQTKAAKDDCESRLQALQGELTTLQADSETLRESSLRNHEMLLQEIQNSHKESEEFFKEWKSLEAAVRPQFLGAERLVCGEEKVHPPHDHLDYVFESASLFDRHWGRLPVRLVEHHGNAGLAIFHTSGNSTKPLHHWEPNGRENGLDFMLFVPSDKKATNMLVGLPTSDLLLVRDATAKILGHLSVHEERGSSRWKSVARRLLREIDEIPERLHYDSVAGFVQRENDEFSIRFKVTNLCFRGQCSSLFVFDWTPTSSGGTLRLEANKADPSMLLDSAPEVVVGFASTEDEESVRKLWPGLIAHDRTFLLLLAQALPDFVFHLCEQHTDQKPQKERLSKQARTLSRKLQNPIRKLTIRKTVAKLIRR